MRMWSAPPVEPEIYRFRPYDWTAVSGVADWVLVLLNLALILTLVLAVRSFRQGEQARTTQILIWAVSQMEEIKPEIALLRSTAEPLPEWSNETKKAAARVSVRLQRLAYMTRQKLIDQSHFKNMWSVTFVDMWDQLKPWVHLVRSSHGEPVGLKEGAFSRRDFEALALEYEPYVAGLRARGEKGGAAVEAAKQGLPPDPEIWL